MNARILLLLLAASTGVAHAAPKPPKPPNKLATVERQRAPMKGAARTAPDQAAAVKSAPRPVATEAPRQEEQPPTAMVQALNEIKTIPRWRMKYPAVQLARKALRQAYSAASDYRRERDPAKRARLLEQVLEANYIVESLSGLVAANGYSMFLSRGQREDLGTAAGYVGLDRGAMVDMYHDRHPELPDLTATYGAGGKPANTGQFNPTNLAQRAARGL